MENNTVKAVETKVVNAIPATNGQTSARDAEMAELRATVARLEAAAKIQNKLTLKVGEKGGLSVYGMGKFPVTLYAGQWERLLENAEVIKEFIKLNDAKLVRKA